MKEPEHISTYTEKVYRIGRHALAIQRETSHIDNSVRVYAKLTYDHPLFKKVSKEQLDEWKTNVGNAIRLGVNQIWSNPDTGCVFLTWDYVRRMPDAWGDPNAMIANDDRTVLRDAQTAIKVMAEVS